MYLGSGVSLQDLGKFFDQGYLQSHLATFCKHLFPQVLVAILNFCVKRKNTFILEIVQDRAISAKVLTPRISAESASDFFQK